MRKLAEKATLVVATGAVLLAVHTTGGDRSPEAQPAGPALPPPSAETISPVHLQLVVPESAAPGERLTVLAFRNRRLCGAAELRFDGAPTAHKLLRYAAPANQDHAQIFMAMDVPRSAKPGSHEIALYGPKPGGSGPICGDVAEHQGRLATATISVDR
ncbi:hypothetical protein ACTMTJ_17585 [Phytohabitans sp. LJ34]|uniref:hypothetical protein n=1 Tax=Phytohabitans sp. LJ34 TaxID=3452217 RepID=UPI003F890E42